MNQQFRIKYVVAYEKSALENVNLAVKKFRRQTSSKFRSEFRGQRKNLSARQQISNTRFSSFERMRNQLDGDREQW